MGDGDYSKCGCRNADDRILKGDSNPASLKVTTVSAYEFPPADDAGSDSAPLLSSASI